MCEWVSITYSTIASLSVNLLLAHFWSDLCFNYCKSKNKIVKFIKKNQKLWFFMQKKTLWKGPNQIYQVTSGQRNVASQDAAFRFLPKISSVGLFGSLLRCDKVNLNLLFQKLKTETKCEFFELNCYNWMLARGSA